jgi:SWIM zinc finger
MASLAAFRAHQEVQSLVREAEDPPSASVPVVRHGKCRLQLRIGGMWYQIRPIRNQPGFRVVWVLKKLDPDGPVVHYSVACPKGEPAGCTCPDHEQRRSICKHMMALAALGLIATPKEARPPRPPKAKQIHAANARQAIAEAKALPAEARRHLAEIAPAPARPLYPDPAAAAAGFRQAIAAHVGRLSGESAPGPMPVCSVCGAEFEPTASDDYCEECLREGGAL